MIETAPSDPAPATPPRRPGSLRRTSTIHMTWPEGIMAGLRLEGRCRDLLTTPEGGAQLIAQHEMSATTGPDRTIRSISTQPELQCAGRLVGARAGGKLRAVLEEAVPELRREGAPLYLLLDDIAGASLIAAFAWSVWRDELPELAGLAPAIPARSMQGVCSGFRPGASSLSPDGTQVVIPRNVAAVAALADSGDPLGWHDQPRAQGITMRRARRIDVWRKGDEVRVDAMFRDSCWAPDASEIGVHEYGLRATADRDAGFLTSLSAQPRVLPYDECPLAAPNAAAVVGAPISQLRATVLERLRGTDCCTHLNDALRALAEVPVLVSALQARSVGSLAARTE